MQMPKVREATTQSIDGGELSSNPAGPFEIATNLSSTNEPP